MRDLAVKAEEMFFYGMQRGYVLGCPNVTSIFRPENWKEVIHKDGMWKVVDSWNDNGGNTKIYRGPDLVWIMRYGGIYPADVIGLLKAALADRYMARDFCGGRGPRSYATPQIAGLYQNFCTGDFSRFSGSEMIYDVSEESQLDEGTLILGEYTYWGGMII
jgi:hypothetical protein